MPFTVAKIEVSVVAKLGAWLRLAGMPVTTAGTNAALADPIRDALLYLSITPADVSTVTDDDLATITTARRAKLFLDAALYETCKSIIGNVVAIDEKIGAAEQKLSQLLPAIRLFMDMLGVVDPTRSQGGAVKAIRAGVPMPNDPYTPSSVNLTGGPYPEPYPQW